MGNIFWCLLNAALESTSMIDKTSDKCFRSSSGKRRPQEAVFFKLQKTSPNDHFTLFSFGEMSQFNYTYRHIQIKVELWCTWWFPVISSTESQYIVARKLVNIKMDKKRFRFPTCQFGALARAIFFVVHTNCGEICSGMEELWLFLIHSYLYLYIYI